MSEQRKVIILWLDRDMELDGERSKWVVTPKLSIKKATIDSVAKFFLAIVMKSSFTNSSR